ncbi:MAG: SusC/RagA family TonB-linked outer membrane protein [Chitinophagaceae bacterium]
MRKILSLMLPLLIGCINLLAQSRTVSGSVSDEKGTPVPFATIKIKGTTKGTTADATGAFNLEVQNASVVLQISSQGFTPQELTIGDQRKLTISLQSNSQLKEVIVTTALGVSRTKRSVGYATQQIAGEKISATKIADLNTALAGKIAGAQVLGGSGAKFGTAYIRLRGVNTLGGGSPIYVVDGVVTTPAGVNPDDIESVNVLKGPAATALYGQRGSEGAVVITSKKGSKKGIGVEVNHTTTFERVYILPEFQNEYGGGYSQDWLTFAYNPVTMPANLATMNGAKYYRYDVDESWGPKMDGALYAPWYAWDSTDAEFGKLKAFTPQSNNVKDFYNTGVANNTTIALSKVTSESNTRFSFTNLTRTGVVPNSKQQKNWLVLSSGMNLTNRLSLSTNLNYVYENLFNVPLEGYSSQTSGSFNQWFHRDVEINKLKRYRRADGTYTSWNIGGPTDPSPKYWDNPYTEVYSNIAHNYVERVFGNFTLSWKIPVGFKFSATARGNFNNISSDSRVGSYTINIPKFGVSESKFRETNFVGSIEYDKSINDLSFHAAALGELMSQKTMLNTESTAGGFIVPDVYNVSNSLNEKVATNNTARKKVNSLYGYASIGYKDFLYLDLSIRNDISSTLPKDNNSYVYGGASASFIFSELLGNNDLFSFGKLRLSFARVGTDVSPYRVYETYPLGSNYSKPVGLTTNIYSTQTVPDQRPNNKLEPTLSTSYEIGTEMRFLNNRVRFDFNYYFREAKGQIIPIAVPGSTGYTSQLINAGNIRNYGYEITLGATAARTRSLTWDVDLNLGINRNKVVELADGIDNLTTNLDQARTSFALTGSPRVSLNARVNKPYGLIQGNGVKRNAAGRALTDDDGFYVTQDNQDLGTVLPDFTGGASSILTYKNFFASFSLDFQKGGRFISVTKMFNAGSGLSKETVGLNSKGKPKRDAVANGGGILLNGVNQTTGKENDIYADTKDLYETALFSVWDQWIYDASYIKLRELSLGYNLPKSLYKKLPIQNISCSIVGQNLWLIASKVKGLDPSELESSWMEGGQLPGTRSVGFNVKVAF